MAMEALQRIYENLPAEYWWLLIVMVVMLPAVPIIMRAHYRFRLWHWQRGAQREGGILPEERYASAPGNPPPDVEWRAAILDLLGAAFVMAVPAIVIAYDLPRWLDIALIGGLLLAGIALAIWRKLNDPPAANTDDDLPDAEIPESAVAGFLVAMVVIVVFLLFAMVL